MFHLSEHFHIDLFDDPAKQFLLIRGSLHACGFWPGALDHDDEASRGVGMDELAMDSEGIKRALIADPPLVSVSIVGVIDFDLIFRSGLEPALWNDLTALDLACFDHKLAESGEVAKACRETATGKLVVCTIGGPYGGLVHGARLPDFCGEIFGKSLTCCRADHDAQEVGIAGVIEPSGPWLGSTLEVSHVAYGGIQAGGDGGGVES